MWTLNLLGKLEGAVPVLLRLLVGVSFFGFHGLEKLRPGGEWDFGQSFAGNGVAPVPLLYLAAWAEFLGGLALILGIFTRWAALGLFAVMLYAILVVHDGDPYGKKELAIAYAGVCFCIASVGPGSMSLDRLFFGRDALNES
ncbi:MAG: DoxX family protein [Planctomycetota bacterium]|jgi:putative oxidoreductase